MLCEEQLARFAPGFKDTVPARQATQGAERAGSNQGPESG